MKPVIVYSTIVVFFTIFILIPSLGITTRSDLLFKECQPEEYTYDNFGPYCLYIQQDYRIYPLPLAIRIMREDNFPNGSYTELNYPLSDLDTSDLKIEWNESGIVLEIDDTSILQIDKEAFIGGR